MLLARCSLGQERPAEPTEMTVLGERPSQTVADRPSQSATQKETQRRGARSTTEALKFHPGVYVQRTGHGQASPYIRGLTGRRTVLLFDGLRINNSLFRQGPNQYLFTIDELSVARFEVLRGSASVELGSNAMGGAVLLHPRLPVLDPTQKGVIFRPTVFARHATADQERAGKLSADIQLSPKLGARVGVGYRTLGQLESGGEVKGLIPKSEAEALYREKAVPRFERDGRTMMGTGYDALTADAQLIYRPSPDERITLAYYTFRQLNAPRTDQCPPPEAPSTWCLNYDEQFRTHTYARADLKPGWSLVDSLELGLSLTRQHELRSNFRESVESVGRDDIDVYSAFVRGFTRWFELADGLHLRVQHGIEARTETIDSAGFQTLIAQFSKRDPITRQLSRGQYLPGSKFMEASAFAQPVVQIDRQWSLRSGARMTYSKATAPADEETDSSSIDRDWLGLTGNAGLSYHPTEAAAVMLNFEQGYRAPNLDDLTGRQLTGQGFQLENPNLRPETSRTVEAGLEWRAHMISAGVWVFRTWLDDPMLRGDASCPDDRTDRSCAAGGANRRLPVQLVNGDTVSLDGFEGDLTLRPIHGLRARSIISWAKPTNTTVFTVGQIKPTTLSRVPPLNGNVEIDFKARSGATIGLVSRWAADADRLSYGDTLDSRIPAGGTPGYMVFDARLGADLGRQFRLNALFENLTDAAYRIHGSSVNEAGRGVVVSLEWTP